MSDTASVQSTGSIHSSHFQDGTEPDYEGYKDDMVRFLQKREGLYRCNQLIIPNAWKAEFGVKYSPFGTYGLKLLQLVEKYPETFYFEGKGCHKWICLVDFRDRINPETLKTNITSPVPTSRPAPRPALRPAPLEPTTISVDGVAYFIASLEKLNMAEFMNLASEFKKKGLNPKLLKLLVEQVSVN